MAELAASRPNSQPSPPPWLNEFTKSAWLRVKPLPKSVPPLPAPRLMVFSMCWTTPMRKSTPLFDSSWNTRCAACATRPRSSSVEPEMSDIQMKSATAWPAVTNGLHALPRRAPLSASAEPLVRSLRKKLALEVPS